MDRNLSKIAIYMNYDRELVSFLEADMIAVYEKTDELWDELYSFEISLGTITNMEELRRQLKNVTDKLEDCGIIAGLSLSGLSFGEFDKRGFYVFDIGDYNPDVFDNMLMDIEESAKAEEEKASIVKNTRPVETETPGVYYLNLIELQTRCPEVSSKEAMRDFLENTPLLELRLVCKHVPPWIENGPYEVNSKQLDNGDFYAVIRKRCCD